MKQKIRAQKLLERLNHHPDEKRKKDLVILRKLKKLTEFKNAKTVLFYLPIKGEVDLSDLLKDSAEHRAPDITPKNTSPAPLLNKKFILPKVANNKGKLTLYYTQNMQDVEKGSFNILEPKSHLKIASTKDVDLAIIPGIAFSTTGHRIGYGKGFYDRLLKKIKCPKVGVAYDFQIVNNIAGQEHDIPMNMIITEKEILKISDPVRGAKKRITKKTKNIF